MAIVIFYVYVRHLPFTTQPFPVRFHARLVGIFPYTYRST